jgi:predicted TIM-barrel fold metal-dependent hydrolase
MERRAFIGALAGVAAGAFASARPAAQQVIGRHRIDFHCHSVPPAMRKFLTANGYGDIMNSWNLSKHLEDMDKGGVATSLLSIASPGVWHGRDIGAIRAATREINDYNAKLTVDYPKKFGMFALLPLPDVEGSLKEVEYAFDTLKADGVGMRTPYGDLWHGEPIFEPLYQELNRRNAIVFTHPQDAPCCQDLVPGVPSQSTIEYGTHTTRTITSLLESRMAVRYPNIRWVFAHAGGTMPFLVSRIVGRKLPLGPDGMIMLDPSDQSRNSGQERLATLRRFYYECAQQTNVVALGALRRVVPISQIVFGTDYPASDSGGRATPIADHAIGLAGVFSGADLRAVESENALRLLPKYRS